MSTQSTQRSVIETLFGWLPDWLGFALIIAAGIASLIVGIINPTVGLIAFGVAAIASAILAWRDGARSSPRGDPIKRSFAGAVTRVSDRTWLIIFALFVVAVIIAVVEGVL